MSNRDLFEAFAITEACPLLRDGEGYKNPRANTFWHVWKAALASAPVQAQPDLTTTIDDVLKRNGVLCFRDRIRDGGGATLKVGAEPAESHDLWNQRAALAATQPAAPAEEARNDEREGIACFLEALGHRELAAQVFAGMTRQINEDRRNTAITASLATQPAVAPAAPELSGDEEEARVDALIAAEVNDDGTPLNPGYQQRAGAPVPAQGERETLILETARAIENGKRADFEQAFKIDLWAVKSWLDNNGFDMTIKRPAAALAAKVQPVAPDAGDFAAYLIENKEDALITEEDMQCWLNDFLAAAPSQQAQAGGLSAAARDVLAERQRQVSAEGWTPEHDDEHGWGQLTEAAACYITGDMRWSKRDLHQRWPWEHAWWKPKDRRTDLVKAGALVLAEIERLDRAAPQQPDDVGG